MAISKKDAETCGILLKRMANDLSYLSYWGCDNPI
jgi:hypothetical protein